MDLLLSENGRSTYDLVVLVASEKEWSDDDRDLVLEEVAAGEYDAIGSYEYEISWDDERAVANAIYERLITLDVKATNFDKIIDYVAQMAGSYDRAKQEMNDNSVTAAVVETVTDVADIAEDVKEGVQAAWKPAFALGGLYLLSRFFT